MGAFKTNDEEDSYAQGEVAGFISFMGEFLGEEREIESPDFHDEILEEAYWSGFHDMKEAVKIKFEAAIQRRFLERMPRDPRLSFAIWFGISGAIMGASTGWLIYGVTGAAIGCATGFSLSSAASDSVYDSSPQLVEVAATLAGILLSFFAFVAVLIWLMKK